MNTATIIFIATCAILFFMVVMHLSFTLGRIYECTVRIKEIDLIYPKEGDE